MAVDTVAKAGVSLPISNAEIPHTDYNVNSLQELFERVKPHVIVAYVKEIG
jgi:hypothetical protein